MAIILRLIRFIFPLLLLYFFFQLFRNIRYMSQGRGYYGSSRSSGNSRANGDFTGSRVRRDPYAVLGCRRDASVEEIRRCYRNMVSKYHPDRFIGQDLDEDFVRLATEKFKEIQSAYDEIKRMKGFS
ncbi:MAG TPA: DnaJ domain-containing protein [Synergistales bacterium]|nr:DnaJ domain-containing protein [Synergistales bacterium]